MTVVPVFPPGNMRAPTLLSLARFLFLWCLVGLPAPVSSTQYGPPGLASEFVFWVRCVLVLTTVFSFVMLLVIALALVRLSHLIVNAGGPRQLGALVHKWCVATGEVAATPGAA